METEFMWSHFLLTCIGCDYMSQSASIPTYGSSLDCLQNAEEFDTSFIPCHTLPSFSQKPGRRSYVDNCRIEKSLVTS